MPEPVQLPAPTGPHRVGRLALDLTDETRPDPFARRESRRRLAVWVWYPAVAGTQGAPAPYLPGKWAVLGPVWGFRPSRVRPHAVEDAPVETERGPFPLLVFSPSGNPPHFYSALLEELASHGYVVAGIAHTFETIPISVLPAGGVRLMNPKAFAGAFSMPGKRPFEEDLRERAELVELKSADVRFVLGELLQGPAALAGGLDSGGAGAFGHSFGGGAAAEAARLDERIGAGASIDGGLWRTPDEIGASTAVLQLFGEHPEYVMPCEQAVAAKYYSSPEYCTRDRETTLGAWQALHERAQPGYTVLVRGAEHASFIDWPLLPLWRFALARRGLGSAAPGVVWRVASDYLLAFFDRHLRGVADTRLDRAAEDERVTAAGPATLFRAA